MLIYVILMKGTPTGKLTLLKILRIYHFSIIIAEADKKDPRVNQYYKYITESSQDEILFGKE